MEVSNPKEMARRLLPWYLAPRFSNVITNVSLEGEKAVVKRNVDLYVTSNTPSLYIPASSMFLYVPYLASKYNFKEKSLRGDRKEVTIMDIQGFVAGYMPNGRYAKFTDNAIRKDIVGNTITITGEPDDFSINMVAKTIARIESGKYFANKIRQDLKKNGWSFSPIGNGTIKAIKIVEGNAESKLQIVTTFFDVSYKNKKILAPGIVPGVISFFGDDNNLPIEDGRVKDTLIDFVKRVSDVGKSFSSVSMLQKATRSTFAYVIGDVSMTDTTKEDLKKRNGNNPWVWITGAPVHTNTRNNIYLDLETNKIIMATTFVPFSPPASLVINYPPFHLLPLSAVANERMGQLKYFAETIPRRLQKLRVDDVTVYADEFEPLGEAKIRFDDIRKILKEGYPKLETLDVMLDKMEKVSYLGDIASMVYGTVRKIDELLISTIKPKEKEKVKSKESKEKEEKEFEDVVL